MEMKPETSEVVDAARAIIASALPGIETLRMESHDSDGKICARFTATGGLHSHTTANRRYSHSEDFTRDAMKGLTQGERAQRFAEEYIRRFRSDEDLLHEAAQAIGELGDGVVRLRDLDVRVTYNASTLKSYEIKYFGWQDNLREEAYRDDPYFWASKPLTLARFLKSRVEADLRNEQNARRGYRIETVIARMIADQDLAPHRFAEMAADKTGHDWINERKVGRGPVQVAGRNIHISIAGGDIRGGVDITDTISWSKGCAVIKKCRFPDTIVGTLQGRELTDVVKHPWFEGVQIASARLSRADREGHQTLTLQTKPSFEPVARAA